MSTQFFLDPNLLPSRPVKVRLFWLDDDNGLHRRSWAQYQRLLERKECLVAFKGRYILAVFAYVFTDEMSPAQLCRAEFIKLFFDNDGFLSTEAQLDGLMDGARLLSSRAEWQELYALVHDDKFGWKPTDEIVSRLRRMISQNSKHG